MIEFILGVMAGSVGMAAVVLYLLFQNNDKKDFHDRHKPMN